MSSMRLPPFQLGSARSNRSGQGRILLLLTLLLAGCALIKSTGPTLVAQGKYYGSGHPDYDEFFLELYRTQVAMAAAPTRLDAARGGLTGDLGLAHDLPTDAIIEHVRAHATELAREGRLMKLVLSRAVTERPRTAVLLVRPTTRDDAVRNLAEPLERASNSLLLLEGDLETTEARFAVLEKRLQTLIPRAKEDFARDGIVKVDEVERNLADAARVLAYMREQARGYTFDARALLDGLAQAADTSEGAFDRPEPETEVSSEPAPADRASKRSPKGTSAAKGSRPPAKPQRPRPSSAPSEPAGFQP